MTASDRSSMTFDQWMQLGMGCALLVLTVYASAVVPLHPTIQRGVFLTAIILVALAAKPLPGYWRLLDAAIAAASIVSIGYLLVNWETLAYRVVYEPDTTEYVLAFAAVLCVLEVTRRVVGWPMIAVTIAVVLYAHFGRILPEPFTHKGYDIGRLVVTQYLTHEGLFGSLLGVAAVLVAAFILFGALLQLVGVADLFMTLAARFSRGTHGGPAKLAVTGSALMGTISGSSTANVVTTGTTTIPLMIRAGYRPEFAAATEAVSSTGGQFMPPIMGVAAFLMAEITGIPYVTIATAAIIPALLYVVCVYCEVDFEARRLNLRERDLLTGIGVSFSLVRGLSLLLPLAVLLYLLLMLYAPAKAAFWGSVTVLLVALPTWRRTFTLEKMRDIVLSFAGAATTVGLACATAGIVIGMLNLTGASLNLSYVLVELAGNSKFMLLLMVMLLCLILGMGLPTPAAYAVAAAFAAPMLTTVGVSKIAAHLFVLYFACISSITPPVAIAAYAAAGLAGCSPMKTAVVATKLGLAAFIVPFMFVEHHALLIGYASAWDTVLATATALVGVAALAVATIGYYRGPVGWLERIGWAGAALFLIAPAMTLSAAGLAVAGALLAYHRWKYPQPLADVASSVGGPNH
ncbi:TRAP transporter permease [Shumkonia mesophila]|uniref:TRAP transporter permease n=1 Tax=Shumkonia mesophila TaxID=2838854 RepID=UPI0029341316|nr:TRAP transporter fused permease subunit [Shumkonia mesophila]